jgi:hypothetical protein
MISWSSLERAWNGEMIKGDAAPITGTVYGDVIDGEQSDWM